MPALERHAILRRCYQQCFSHDFMCVGIVALIVIDGVIHNNIALFFACLLNTLRNMQCRRHDHCGAISAAQTNVAEQTVPQTRTLRSKQCRANKHCGTDSAANSTTAEQTVPHKQTLRSKQCRKHYRCGANSAAANAAAGGGMLRIVHWSLTDTQLLCPLAQ